MKPDPLKHGCVTSGEEGLDRLNAESSLTPLGCWITGYLRSSDDPSGGVKEVSPSI